MGNKKILTAQIVMQGAVFCMIIISFFMVQRVGIGYLNREYIINNSLDIMGLFIVLTLMTATGKNIRLFDEMLGPEGWYYGLLFVTGQGLFSDFICWTVQGIPQYALVNKLANTQFYLCSPAIVYVFWVYITKFVGGLETRKKRILWHIQSCLLVVAVILIVLNWFYGFYFTIDVNGVYKRTDGSFLINIIPSMVILLITTIEMLKSKVRKQEKISFLIFAVTPLLSYAAQIVFLGISVTFSIISISLLLVYISAQANRARQLADLKVRMVQSQLQPHFVFNGMSSIRMLIKKDPDKAVAAMDHFMGYLRGTIDAYNNVDMFSIEAELKIVSDYLEIEQVRFGENIQYEIINESEGFMVPPLSIQPLVENAIKHGIRQRLDGSGKVTINVYDKDAKHVIVIEDNGVGFDKKDKKPNDGHVHIGLDSTIRRFEYYLGGKVTVESEEGKGTKVVIVVPEKK